METVRIRDPGWKKSRIRDKHAESESVLQIRIRTLSVVD